MAKLSKMDVLAAVKKACSPYSMYIIDEVRRTHDQAVMAGATGHVPKSALVLRRLKELAADGVLVQSSCANGYYGYRWEITESGRAALKEAT